MKHLTGTPTTCWKFNSLHSAEVRIKFSIVFREIIIFSVLEIPPFLLELSSLIFFFIPLVVMLYLYICMALK